MCKMHFPIHPLLSKAPSLVQATDISQQGNSQSSATSYRLLNHRTTHRLILGLWRCGFLLNFPSLVHTTFFFNTVQSQGYSWRSFSINLTFCCFRTLVQPVSFPGDLTPFFMTWPCLFLTSQVLQSLSPPQGSRLEPPCELCLAPSPFTFSHITFFPIKDCFIGWF